MSRLEFLKEVSVLREMYPQWRFGQAVAVHARARYDLAREADLLKASKLDCFYDDKKIWVYLTQLDLV